MAESGLICNENNFINNESSDNVDKDVEIVEENNEEEVMITSPPLPQQQPPPQQDEQQQQHPPNSVTPEEIKTTRTPNGDTTNDENVESPTTRQNYIFKCVFCEQILTSNDDPKLLECLHNACGNCITQKILDNHDNGADRSQVECAQCHIQCEPEKIIDNHFLLEYSNSEESKLAELKCSSCSDDAMASSWCEDCREFICDICVQAHQRLKITKDHTIKPKEDGLNDHQNITSNSTSTLLCSIHPHEKLSLFCENCDKLTCRDCQLIEHREHKYKFTNEIALEARRYIGDMLKDVNYKRTLLNSAMKVIDDRQALIVDKKQALVKEVTQLVVKLTNTINIRGKQLVAKLTEVCDSKQKTLQEKKHALDQLSKMTDHAIEFTQHALDNGSDMALLYSKKQMTDHLKNIKCKRADIPNPEIPVRIHLAVDKFPELIKVISAIGQIVVDGRIYPSQAASPLTSVPPHGSPSPRQEQLALTTTQSQQQSSNYQTQQPQPQSFPPTRLPPPSYQYSSFMNQMASQNIDYGAQKIANNMPPQPPPMTGLQQQLQRMPITSRPLMQRPILPRLTQTSSTMSQQQMLTRDHNYQQVSSSTHPQRILQDNNNLRGLLQHNNNSSSNNSSNNNNNSNNNPVYVQTGPGQYQAVQPQLAQQYQNRFTHQQQPHSQQSPQLQYRQQNPVRVVVPNQPPNRFANLQRPFNVQSSMARWHIPQQITNHQIPNLISNNNMINNNNINNVNINNNRNIPLPTINDNFKITLKQQNQTNLPSTVTSTIPKTPSPNHIQNRTDTERNLDKYCEDSVKDLMATIAKLDSNGVQVVAEGRQKTGGSPHIVDSSTGDNNLTTNNKTKNDTLDSGKDDPNEDWCAVCMDGGELVCCDKCPKVFHQYCHIPNLTVEENDTWQCLLCTNFADFPENLMNERKEGELSYRERKIAERIVLELYCQYDPSLPFREVIGPENTDYHAIIKRPIALDTIRQKLNWDSLDHYTSMEQLLKDIRLMFKNAYTYNPEDSLVYNDAKTLEKFFDEQLEKFLPEYAYEQFEDDDDDDIQPPNKRYRRIIND